jgi:hypothetical protein
MVRPGGPQLPVWVPQHELLVWTGIVGPHAFVVGDKRSIMFSGRSFPIWSADSKTCSAAVQPGLTRLCSAASECNQRSMSPTWNSVLPWRAPGSRRDTTLTLAVANPPGFNNLAKWACRNPVWRQTTPAAA